MQQQAQPVTHNKPDYMTEEEYAAYRRMREANALVPINDALLPSGGWLVNGCEDGERAPEAIQHLRRRTKSLHGGIICTHLPLIVGGPASAVRACPFYELTYRDEVVALGDKLLFARIEKALLAKVGKIPNFANQPHCQCGMCRLHKVSIWDNFLFSIQCKDLVRKEFGDNFRQYAVLPHFDLSGYPEAGEEPGVYRTYHLQRGPFEKLLQRITSAH